jgi:glycosyltransferase involved in cell wall biosynthesis
MPTNRFNVGFLGTLDYHKGLDFLFECIQEINKNYKKIFFIIGGDISVKSNLLSKILHFLKIKKNIKTIIFSYEKKLKNVKFLGQVKNLDRFYNNLSLIVFPSRMNALGRPIIEASSYAIPSVVCLEKKNINDTIVHKKTGYITKFGNKSEFVNYIVKIYNNKSLFQKLKKNSYKLFLKTHSSKYNIQVMKKMYNDAL